MKTLQTQLDSLSALDKTSREYQLVLAQIKSTASKLLSESSTKVLPCSSEVHKEILDSLEDCFNHEVDISTYFTEFESTLDSTLYREFIKGAVRDKLRTECFSRGLNVFYVKMLSRVSTLRKLRASLEVLQCMLEMKENIEYLKKDVKVQMVYPLELLMQNTKLREEQEKMYGVYTQDDKEIGLYFKYRKLKEDGVSLRESAEILGMTKSSLQRLAAGFTSEIQPSNCVRFTAE